MEELGLRYDFLDLHKFLRYGRIVNHSCKMYISVSNKAFSLDQYGAIYHRLSLDESLIGASTYRRLVQYRTLASTLVTMHHTGASLVINPPSVFDENSSKLWQLTALNRFGLKTPPTCVSNSARMSRQFVDVQTSAIYKSCSSERSIVEMAPDVSSERYQTLITAPCLFQKNIVGNDVRVHIVGNTAVSELITSQGVDYRYARENEHKLISTPRKIKEALIRYMKNQKLSMIGADFKIESTTGQWYVLEVNTMPGYAGYDERSGGKISKNLIGLMRKAVQR